MKTLSLSSKLFILVVLIGIFLLSIFIIDQQPIHQLSLTPQANDPQPTNPQPTNPQPTNQNPTSSSCKYGVIFSKGSYQVRNNQWNNKSLAAGETFQQCIYIDTSQDPLRAGWDWSWPRGNDKVKAYPEILYGWPRSPGSTDSHLPVQLSKMGGFVANFDTSVSAPGATYNTSFDLWITNSASPTMTDRICEIMIWVDEQNITGWLPYKPVLGRLAIDGQQYDVYKSECAGTLVSFVKVIPMPTGSIAVDHFVNYLVEKGIIPADGYLATIEFGNEIVAGSGHTTIRSYSIQTSN
jgi:hypothetical protein